MPELFEAARLGALEVKNRFVRSATWEGMAEEDGRCTPSLAERMGELAENEVGLVISSHAYVSLEGQAGPWQLGIYSDAMIEGLKLMTARVHEGGGKAVCQLAHAGCQARSVLTGETPIGPSPAQNVDDETCREMTRDDIERVVEAFGQAARRAREAGFDGVQIHAAHGFLLSEFLSPAFNQRTDEYGGEPANRARIVCETIDAVREYAGRDFPILIKINAADFLNSHGLTEEDSLEVCRILGEKGLDGVELSGGTRQSGKFIPSRTTQADSPEAEPYYRDTARKFKRMLDLPLILVGGIRSFEVAELLVEEGTADFIALSRPLVREPDLVKRWKAGDTAPSLCLSDNLCFKPIFAGKALSCHWTTKAASKHS